MAPYTDVYFPSLYFMFTRADAAHLVPYISVYLEEQLSEVKRVRRMYGRLESPIYPYVCPQVQGLATDLDADVWETTLRISLDEADGMVLWGGWQVPWDENAPWWVTIKAQRGFPHVGVQVSREPLYLWTHGGVDR